MLNIENILKFWFVEIDSKKWWVKDRQFDELIKERFLHFHKAATQGELFTWRSSIDGRLAEIIILDQFSRNIFRNSPQAFAFDGMALLLAQECVSLGLDRELPKEKRSFIYMPYMHSESQIIHREAVKLFSQAELKNSLDFELKHKLIIDRFGRYPHRNAILGRPSSKEELEFLNKPGSSF